MQFISITSDTCFNHPVFGEGILKRGRTYYAFGEFARKTSRLGVGHILEDHPIPLCRFDPSLLVVENGPQNILFLFAGGMGDAITIGTVLPAVIRKYRRHFDICCPKKIWEGIFNPMGLSGKRVPYPPDLETLAAYDAVLEDITNFYHDRDNLKISPVIQLLLGFQLADEKIYTQYEIPDGIIQKFKIPSSGPPKIGINFESNGRARSYPEKLQESLVGMLRDVGFEIYLLGTTPNRSANPIQDNVTDFRGRTTLFELAALLYQMDLVLCVDSFTAHLSNLLGTDTVVLISTTSASIFEWHKHISCISSRCSCTPCFNALDDCPRAYSECIAFYHESIRPGVIAEQVIDRLKLEKTHWI